MHIYTHRSHVTSSNSVDFIDQIMPGDYTLHVYVRFMPKSEDTLILLLNPETYAGKYRFLSLFTPSENMLQSSFLKYPLSTRSTELPVLWVPDKALIASLTFSKPQTNTNLFAKSTASLFGGGTVKHTDGTIASFPVGLMTFHLAR